MDMKKLKTTMWGLLTESPEKPDKVCNRIFLTLVKLFYFLFFSIFMGKLRSYRLYTKLGVVVISLLGNTF